MINPLPNPQTPNAVGAHNSSTFPAVNGKVKEVTAWSKDLTLWLQNQTITPMVNTINKLSSNNPGAVSFIAPGTSPYTLPAATGSDDQHLIKNTTGAPLVIQAAGGSTIDGVSSYTIPIGGSATFYDYGTGTWAIVASYNIAAHFINAVTSPYNLPAATGSQSQYIVKNNSGVALTVNGTIDGGSSLIVPVKGSVTFYDYGSGTWAAV